MSTPVEHCRPDCKTAQDTQLNPYSAEIGRTEAKKNRVRTLIEVQTIEKDEGILVAEPYYLLLADVLVRRRNGIYATESAAITSQDSISAQKYLAQLYATGNKEIPRNSVKAFRWYNHLFDDNQDASIQASIFTYLKTAEASLLLAIQKQNFEAIKQHVDILEAEVFVDYTLTPKTLYCLAKTFENGYDGVQQNKDKAFNCCKKASERSDPDALFTLGYYHELGIGTPKNLEKAWHYYAKSADKDKNNDAILRLKMHKAIKLGKKFFTENTFKANEKLITTNKANIEAVLIVAICYMKGWGTKQDIITGFNHLIPIMKTHAVAKIYHEQFKPVYETEHLKVLAQKALDEKRLAEQELEKKRIEAAKAAKAKRKAKRKQQLESEAAEKAQREAEKAEKAEKAKQEAAARKEKDERIARKKQERKAKKEALQKQALEEQQTALKMLEAKNKQLEVELEAKCLADAIAQKKLEVDAKEKLLKQQSLLAQQIAIKQLEARNNTLEIELQTKQIANEIAQKQQEVNAKEKLLQQQKAEEDKIKKRLAQQQRELSLLEAQLQKSDIKQQTEDLAKRIVSQQLALSATETWNKTLRDEIGLKQAELAAKNQSLTSQQTILTSLTEKNKALAATLHHIQLTNEIGRQTLEIETIQNNLSQATQEGYFISAALQLRHKQTIAPVPLFQSLQPTPHRTPIPAQQPVYAQSPPLMYPTVYPLLPLPTSLPPGSALVKLNLVVPQLQHITNMPAAPTVTRSANFL